jgi:adenylate kinase family enzyme
LTQLKATELLKLGVVNYSKFGRLCPVLLKDTQKCDISQFGNQPVLVGDEVFYLQGKQNLIEFEKNLHVYISQEEPKPMLASTCCIVGNPKSGKTTLGKKIAAEINGIHLTVSIILQNILDGNECTSLYEQIRSGLRAGKSLPDRVIVDAVIVMTNRLISNGKSCVLDGFPTTTEQAEMLDLAGFQPHLFFELHCSETEVKNRSSNDSNDERLRELM